MNSSVLQGSVMGPLLLVLHINNVDKNVRGMNGKFIDGVKIGTVVEDENSHGLLMVMGY